jgi:glycosyltransferase involved in cell wall biosynthesis
MSPDTPIAIVTPWWNEEVSGGAEFLARQLAFQLLARGRRVEVLTTCGRDPFSDWSEDHFPPGCSEENGLTVRRFRLDLRNATYFAQLSEVLASGQFLPPPQEQDFLANSINSRALCQFIEENRDRYVFCFIPYLYGTTYCGIRAAGGRAIIIPCLHNEPIAYLWPFQQMMASVRGAWFLSEPECGFARTLYPIQRVEKLVAGPGMDFCRRGDGETFRREHGLNGPVVMFAGRRVPGKGFDLLLNCFARVSKHHPEWTLVLAGAGERVDEGADLSHVLDIGFVEKQVLWDALAAATVFCQPSRYESFSYVLMESWVQGTPALVNATCGVLRWQCKVAGGGLWFGDEDEFEGALCYLQSHADVARQIGRQGADYVARNLRWATVMDKVEEFLSACGFK